MAFISPDHGWLNIAPENGCLGNKPFLSFWGFSVTFQGLCEKLLGCLAQPAISVGVQAAFWGQVLGESSQLVSGLGSPHLQAMKFGHSTRVKGRNL